MAKDVKKMEVPVVESSSENEEVEVEPESEGEWQALIQTQVRKVPGAQPKRRAIIKQRLGMVPKFIPTRVLKPAKGMWQ